MAKCREEDLIFSGIGSTPTIPLLSNPKTIFEVLTSCMIIADEGIHHQVNSIHIGK
jgi:hypothetical protein